MCKNGLVDMLKYLDENKQVEDPVTYKTGKEGMTCLHMAVVKNKP